MPHRSSFAPPAAANDTLPTPSRRTATMIDWQHHVIEPAAAAAGNQNTADLADTALIDQLPPVIREAIEEWVGFLKPMCWMTRRPVMDRFCRTFADNFRQQRPHLSAAEYDSLRDLGFTCLLERLDDGGPVIDSHHARCFANSIHGHQQQRAEAFWRRGDSHLALVH